MYELVDVILTVASSSDFFLLAGDFFPPTFNCPHRVDRIGVIGDGGKWVCGIEVVAMKQECVIYSIGEA